MRDALRFPGRVPLIGGATVGIDDAAPMDIALALQPHMPHYAMALAQHVRTTEAMLGEALAALKAMGVQEVRRAGSATNAPNDGNPNNGDGNEGPVM